MSTRLLQGALLIAAAGAIVLVADLFGTAGAIAGLAAAALGTVLAAPAARGTEGGWWNALAAGTLLCGAGAALSALSEPLGGIVVVLGVVMVVAAATLTFPLG
jgi:hypothetical protein